MNYLTFHLIIQTQKTARATKKRNRSGFTTHIFTIAQLAKDALKKKRPYFRAYKSWQLRALSRNITPTLGVF